MNNEETITCVIVLFENQILSWKITLGKTDFELCGLSNKYFLGIDKNELSIKQKSFEHSENNSVLWNKAHKWMKQWEIHPIAQKFIDNGKMYSPHKEEKQPKLNKVLMPIKDLLKEDIHEKRQKEQ